MPADNIMRKIKEMVRNEGYTPTEAAQCMGIDLDAASLASLAFEERVVTIEELIEEGKLKAIKLLNEVIEDVTCETKDRVNAAKIVLTGAGEMPKLNGIVDYEERLRRVRKACGEPEIVDAIEVSHAPRLMEMAI